MIVRLIIAALAVAGWFFNPAQLAAQNQADEDPFIAVVMKVTPPVQLRRADGEELVPLQRDDRLYPGDHIICGDGGYASLIFADSAVELKMYPNTELTMQGQRTSRNIIKRVFLPVGQLLSRVVSGDMGVVTPTAVASVKGTEWWTMVEPSTLTRVIVTEGQVNVEHRVTGETEVVSAGNTAVATPEGELEVSPTEESPEPEHGSLDIEFEDDSGQKKTLHIEFDR